LLVSYLKLVLFILISFWISGQHWFLLVLGQNKQKQYPIPSPSFWPRVMCSVPFGNCGESNVDLICMRLGLVQWPLCFSVCDRPLEIPHAGTSLLNFLGDMQSSDSQDCRYDLDSGTRMPRVHHLEGEALTTPLSRSSSQIQECRHISQVFSHSDWFW